MEGKKMNRYKEWKTKLNNLLHQSNNICGICLECQRDLWNVYNFEFNQQYTLETMLKYIFNSEEVQGILCNSMICKNCADTTLQIFNFITNVKKSSKVIRTFLKCAHSHIDDTLYLLDDLADCEKFMFSFDLRENLNEYDERDITAEINDEERVNDVEETIEMNTNKKVDTDEILEDVHDEISKDIHDEITIIMAETDAMETDTIESDTNSIDGKLDDFNEEINIKVTINPTDTDNITNTNNKRKTNSYDNTKWTTTDYTKTDDETKKLNPNLKNVQLNAEGTKHMCGICKLSFNSKFNHDNHYRRHLVEKKLCPLCFKNVTASYLEAHIRRHLKLDTVKHKYVENKDHMCDLCGKFYKTSKILLQHKEIHKDHKQCDICKAYMMESALESHIKTHSQNKPLKTYLYCDSCNFITLYPYTLEAHKNRIHLKMRPYKCTECEKDFYTRDKLHEHMKKHCDIKLYGKCCSTCGLFFSNNQTLECHERTHSGEKPFACEICGECFISNSYLQDHKLKRHSTASIPCPICKNLYHSVRYLRAHVKKCHFKGVKNISMDNIEGLTEEEFAYIFTDRRKL